MPPWFWMLSVAFESAALLASAFAIATCRATPSSPSSSATAAYVTIARATSTRTAMSAQRCLIAWNVPMGLPNCRRTLAYSTDSSSVRSATPSASAAASVAPSSRQRRASPPSGTPPSPANVTVPIRRVGSMLGTLCTRTPGACAAISRAASRPRTRKACAAPASRTVCLSPSSLAPRASRWSAACTTATRGGPASTSLTRSRGHGVAASTRAPSTVPSQGPGMTPRPISWNRSAASRTPYPAPSASSGSARPNDPSDAASRHSSSSTGGSAVITWRTRAGDWRSARTPRMASRTASCSGPRVRSMMSSARQAEHALADDVALDLLRAAADGLRQPGEVPLRPLPARRAGGVEAAERLRAEDVHREHVDALAQLREEQPDHRRLGTRHAGARRQAQAAVRHGAHRLDLGGGQREAAGDLVVVDGSRPPVGSRDAARHLDQLVEPAREPYLLRHEGGPALEAERRHGH